MNPLSIVTVVGARPQFIKAAAVSLAFARHNLSSPSCAIEERIIHTGQHYDENMSGIFFDQLNIPRPWSNLDIGSGSHGSQTAKMMEGIEKLLTEYRPDYVMTYGDTNSTLASALVAAKMHIPVIHIESGLRSFNKRMPEEVNRILTDHVSEWLFCPTSLAIENLKKEGITNNVVWTGDVMYDAALTFAPHAEKSTILTQYGLQSKQYKLATVHRAENTDQPDCLRGIFEALTEISTDSPVVLPIHPRTRSKLESAGMLHLALESSLVITEPVNFLDMICLEKNAQLILTDSGGIQKEAFFHDVPCVTLREETEWVELVNSGWNVLVGAEKERIVENSEKILARFETDKPNRDSVNYGSGAAAQVIIDQLINSTTLPT